MLNIFKRIREKKENTKKSQAIIKDFVEGNITIEEFWEIYKKDISIRKCIYGERYKLISYFPYFDCDNEQLDKINLDNIGIRVTIFRMCKLYLQIKKIDFSPKNEDDDKYQMLSNICPSWLKVDVEFLTNIIQNAPMNLNKENKIKWCRHKITEMFKVEKYYPQWLQDPEWPIIDGIPLVFKSQSHKVDNINTDSIKYYFYHPETKEEVIVEQYD